MKSPWATNPPPNWNRRRAIQDMAVLAGTFAAFIGVAYEFSVFGADVTHSLDPAKRIDFYEAVAAGALLFCGIWIFALRRVRELRREMQRRADAEMRLADADFRASHDPLTGLGNRSEFDRTMESLIATPPPPHGSPGGAALLLLDLNGFKSINDRFGHPFGDEVLKIIAKRLRSHTRDSDKVCRLGGDEFAVIARRDPGPPAGGSAPAEAIAQGIIRTIDEPIALAGRTIQVGVAIGIAHYPKDGTTTDDLVGKADQALYAAKEENRASRASTYVVSS